MRSHHTALSITVPIPHEVDLPLHHLDRIAVEINGERKVMRRAREGEQPLALDWRGDGWVEA